MKTAICYHSRHHGNTLKVVEAMTAGREIETHFSAISPKSMDER
ncbi:MAG: hypothetical protein RR316_06565 [Clostridia bacterium]